MSCIVKDWRRKMSNQACSTPYFSQLQLQRIHDRTRTGTSCHHPWDIMSPSLGHHVTIPGLIGKDTLHVTACVPKHLMQPCKWCKTADATVVLTRDSTECKFLKQITAKSNVNFTNVNTDCKFLKQITAKSNMILTNVNTECRVVRPRPW